MTASYMRRKEENAFLAAFESGAKALPKKPLKPKRYQILPPRSYQPHEPKPPWYLDRDSEGKP